MTKSRRKGIVWTVHAKRWGDEEAHNYIVGVYDKKQAALAAAETEEQYRGGKYGCEVVEWTLNKGIAGRLVDDGFVVRTPFKRQEGVRP